MRALGNCSNKRAAFSSFSCSPTPCSDHFVAVRDVALAAAVSLAVLAASTVTTLVAMALPYVLHRLGYDPAFGSGSSATVIEDLSSIALRYG